MGIISTFAPNKNIMTHLFGSYECKVDTKGRLMLPSGIKKQLQSVLADGFIMKKNAYHPCLELYPGAEWEKVIKKIERMPRFSKESSDFIRRFTAGFKNIDLDNAGRMLIPKDLTAFASIKKDIVLTASINRIEIWDKTTYDKVVNDESVNFAELAEKYMSNLDEDF